MGDPHVLLEGSGPEIGFLDKHRYFILQVKGGAHNIWELEGILAITQPTHSVL